MTQVDLVIIGAGPAGLAAANEAQKGGARVVLLDEQPVPGGQIYRNVLAASARQDELLGADYIAGRVLARTVVASNIDYRSGATVWNVGKDGAVLYSHDGRGHRIAGRHLLLATGALERPVPIPGWTLPGVMTAGAAQILLKTSSLAARDAVLVGAGPLLYLVAHQMISAGFAPKALIETQTHRQFLAAMVHAGGALTGWRAIVKGMGLIRSIREAGVQRFTGANNVRIEGLDAAEAVCFDIDGFSKRLETDTVLLHQGVVPNTQISRTIGLQHFWNRGQHCFCPVTDEFGRTSLENISIAGDGAGISGAKAAEYSGRIAALDILAHQSFISLGERNKLARGWMRLRRGETAIRPFLDALYAPPAGVLRPAGKTVVCRCEEVTAEDIRNYVALGCCGPNQIKAFSRCGMGPCQGRFCGTTVTNILADELNVMQDEVGAFRIRTPLKPVTLGELAAMGS
jgi:NADPH-dependent 2,4-dienoyl-CoA reductase/sulfur reductase-like enzyme